MKKVAVYPGTFDPITFGHIDVIKKALKLFDKVIVAASDGANKNYLFNSIERIEIIKKALFYDFVILTIPPLAPGTAPLTNNKLFSTSTRITFKFFTRTLAPPMRPGIPVPLKTLPG